ncbi:hypothetical protein EG240_09605 [Paenimyroides tangerinum]|uniref:Uncharacterized protein n=1 Tax=Paenimyroides tangerinum TaxID=2488728 RepID=A0A3P3W4T6_9FLAO|nr:hypothetical protein [Paenimyroides tangerinum]RRJ90115.1 hypothetical protein EG240_09605 [Paenimyroides tangerinum]
MKYISILFLFFITIQNPIYSQEKGDKARLVLYSSLTDTLKVNVKNAYPFGLNFDAASSYAGGKVYFFENAKRIKRKANEIKYLEFKDRQGKLRRYTFNPRLEMSNVSEILVSGKINLFLNVSLVGISNRSAIRFLEKEDEIIPFNGFNKPKKLRENLIRMMSDEPELQKRLENSKLEDHEILAIIKEYNSL